jgi:S1-C subfamily serine protease
MILISQNTFLLLFLSFFVFSDNAAGAEFYKWMDKDGVVHLSDRIPEDGERHEDALPKMAENDNGRSVNHSSDIKTVLSQSGNPIKTSIDSTFSIKGDHNLGTGFFISPNGYAITCKHVLKSDNNTAVLNDGSEYPIGIISINDKYDLALIMVLTSKKTTYLSIRDPFSMTPGDRVYAVGNSQGLQATIADGAFTGLREDTKTNVNVVQFSAPIYPGNSGGPLVDEKGKAIGVVSWKIVSQKGTPVNGVGFAIPSDYLVKEYGYYLK